MTTSFSSSSTIRRIAVLASLLMLLLASGARGVQAASPAPGPAPAPAPNAAPKASPKAAPNVVAPAPPAPRKAAPRALGTRAIPSAALGLPNCGAGGCDLYAKEGTIALPGPTTLPIWGFTIGAADAATLPGPTLIAIAGQPLSITLHNMLPAADGTVSLEVPGAVVARDEAEVASGGAPHAYNLNGLTPGTYLYEAGTHRFPANDQGARQVAMGMSGILIIRPSDFTPVPATQTAYGLATPKPGAFSAEATVLVNEIDQEFHNDPRGRDLIEYKPSFFLVNGRAFDPANPTLGKIDVIAGDQLLLHEANLGLTDREIGVLGARQSILANDSRILQNPIDVATNFMSSGQVSDAFVQVDPGLAAGAQLPLFDGGLHLHNDASSGLGGMMTYLDVQVGVGGLPGGPVTTNVVATPAVNDGTQDTSVTDTIKAQGLGVVTQAEWFLDNVGAPGSGHAITPLVPGASVNANFTITAAQLQAAVLASTSVPSGDHIIWVHGYDLTKLQWGDVSGDVITTNYDGALVSAITLHPDRTNGALPNNQDGTNDAIVMATAESSLSGWIVDLAKFCIDTPNCANPTTMSVGPSGGANIVSLGAGRTVNDMVTNGTTMITSATAGFTAGDVGATVTGTDIPAGTTISSVTNTTVATLSQAASGSHTGGTLNIASGGNIPAAALLALSEGAHTIYIYAHETNGTTGRWPAATVAPATASLVIDRTGPAAINPSVQPTPNNGTLNGPGNLGFLNAVRAAVDLSDATAGGSDVVLAEAFLGGAAAPASADNGTGAEMVPASGKWGGVSQTAYAYIPLAEINAQPEGIVNIWMHGKDSAGNWGPFANAKLTLDKTAPVITATSASGAPGAATVTVTANDPTHAGVNSNIIAAEWWIGVDPGFGSGTGQSVTAGNPVTFSFPVNGKPSGATVSLRVQDAAGNWSTTSTQVIP